ncbi:MAG: hypothetical protein J2P55_09585 [Rhizobiales bacterium]|nr:hypothetical protein [Hyphomicrobiales bacterium]
MSDTTQGQDATLFEQATGDLDSFENPQLPEPREAPKAPENQNQQNQPDNQTPDAAVPSGRFREESEARRRAEREAQDLRARLAAYEVQPRQQPQQQPKLDVFDNPQGFVQQEIKPFFEQMRAEMQMTREAMSADNAVRVYGEPNVSAARAALEQGMARHDPNAWATYNRAMTSHDPYGVITRWHMDRETLQQIGGDLASYKTKILEEAMKDPEFQRKVIEATRSSAPQVNRPITQSSVPNLPSLSDIGAAGGDEQAQDNVSDEALFRQAVSAKRRRN